jgi:tryptophanyl-tRNA synthetase
VYCTTEEIEEVTAGCRTAGIGCLDCKKIMIKHVLEELAPIQERRARLKSSDVEAALAQGNRAAGEIAESTMGEVRTAMGLNA